jgi:ribosomal protein L18E
MKEEKEQLRNKLMLLGLNGMAYTPIWNEVAKKLNQKSKEKNEVYLSK